MPHLRLGLLLFTLVLFVGCTEMRVEGEAKVFQSSAVGKMIGIGIGLGLMGLGGVA